MLLEHTSYYHMLACAPPENYCDRKSCGVCSASRLLLKYSSKRLWYLNPAMVHRGRVPAAAGCESYTTCGLRLYRLGKVIKFGFSHGK